MYVLLMLEQINIYVYNMCVRFCVCALAPSALSTSVNCVIATLRRTLLASITPEAITMVHVIYHGTSLEGRLLISVTNG